MPEEKLSTMLEENELNIQYIILCIGESMFQTPKFKGTGKTTVTQENNQTNTKIIITSQFTHTQDNKLNFEIPFIIEINIKN